MTRFIMIRSWVANADYLIAGQSIAANPIAGIPIPDTPRYCLMLPLDHSVTSDIS